MRSESLSGRTHVLKVVAICVVIGVVMIGVTLNQSEQEKGHRNTISRKEAVGKYSKMEKHEVTGDAIRNCLTELKRQASRADMGNTVAQSGGARYHTFDKDSVAMTKRSRSVDMKSPKILLITTNQPHKAFWTSRRSMALVYGNNMVVSVDIAPRCQVTDVFEPTPQSGIHPAVVSQILGEKSVAEDALCNGAYLIKGVAANAYLNYDTNPTKVVNKEANQIDAVNPSDGDYSKWQVEYFPQPVMEGATLNYLYKVLSAKPSILFKYLTTKSGSEVVAHHTLVGENTQKGLMWQFYQVEKDTAPVAVKIPGLLMFGKKVVMENVQTGRCLCILKNGRYDPNSVKMCPCTDVHAVLVFESTSMPAAVVGLDEE